MRKLHLMIGALLLCGMAAGCDRRKDDLHMGVEWARKMMERGARRGTPESISLAGVLDGGGDPVHWLTASMPEQGTIPCCDREPRPWRVTVTTSPEGLVTIAGYGDDLGKPLETAQVRLAFAPLPAR